MPRKRGKMDVTLVALIIILLFFGTIMVFSASTRNDMASYGNPYYTVTRQLIWFVVGVVVMLLVAQYDYRKIKKHSFLIVFGAIALLGLVLIVGIRVNGGKRWLGVGSLGIQPSEFAKLALIIFFANQLSKERGTLKGFSGMVNIIQKYLLIPGVVFLLIIKEPNMSTGFVIIFIIFIMLFVGGLGRDIIVFFGLTGFAGAMALIFTSTYRLNRLLFVFDPWKDPANHGWQAINSLYAIGSGGIFGMGLGQGREKFGYLPMPNNDFIFSVTCEELGLIGAIFLITMFILLIYKIMNIAFLCEDKFGYYLVCGIAGWIIVQIILHMLIAVSFFPVTGIPLPFISAGGSSALFIMAAMGVVLNVSRYNRAAIKEDQL